MNDREKLKAMIKPRSHDRGSWFIAHFRPCRDSDTWHPVFAEFMDLRHRLKADFYPCKYFEYCLLDDFVWAECLPFKECPGWDKWKNCPNELKCIKVGGGEDDCKPITYGQFLDDAGPIAEANRAAWRDFINRHLLDKTDLTRATDEMQPGIDYYNTHNDFIGLGLFEQGRPVLDEPTPLPAWVAELVAKEPELCPRIYWRKWRENGRPRCNQARGRQ